MKKSDVSVGAKGWFLIIFGMCLFITGGPFWTSVVANVTISLFAQSIGTTADVLLNVHTIVSVVTIVANFITGALYRKMKAKTVNIALLVIEIIGICVWVNTKTIVSYAISRFFILFAAQIVCQFGLGVVYSRYFPTKKGYVLGWVTVGAAAANIVGLPVLSALIPKLGLNGAFYVIAGWVALWALVNLIFIPEDPAKMNYQPDNGVALQSAAPVNPGEVFTTKQIMSNRNFWFMTIGYGLLTAISAGYMAQLVPHLGNNGVPQEKAVVFVAAVAVVGMISSAISGVVDQAIGTRKTSMIVAGSYALATLIMGLLPFNTVTMILSLLFFCCVMGAVSNVGTSHAIGAFGSHNFVKVWGFMFPISAIMVAPMTSILAVSLKSTGKFNMAYAIFGVLAVVAFILIGLSADVLKQENDKLVSYRSKKGEITRIGK